MVSLPFSFPCSRTLEQAHRTTGGTGDEMRWYQPCFRLPFFTPRVGRQAAPQQVGALPPHLFGGLFDGG